MTFPAWFAFQRDPTLRRHVIAHAVYAEMIIRPRSHAVPVEVKGWAWAKLLGTTRMNIWVAVNLLVERGFLHEHPRPHRKAPRRFTVAYEQVPRDT
jgi:hypothetical protein